jgi:type I restriction enzyme M protein
MDEKENSRKLQQILWEGADILRSKMDANEYKDYLLAVVFYKYLSDKLLVEANRLWTNAKPSSMQEAQGNYEQAYEDPDFKNELKRENRYLIKPNLTYTNLVAQVNNNEFQRESLKTAFNEIEQSDKIFENLFADVDLYSTRLGTTEQKQNESIAEVIRKVNEADLLNYSGDVLGDAYEYMIGEFASETGKKAGEFYTPKAVAQILAKIASIGQEDKQGLSVYDPTMGSASLLLEAKRYSKHAPEIRYYGQELVTSTYNLARMNMFLHAISPENQHLHNADTLDADWPTGEDNLFDMVVMNPPYSQNWAASQGFLQDPRFMDYGVLPPKSKADYAFLLHGFYHLRDTGTMAIVLPHGVLFRGSSEGAIRQKLCESGSIYAVIGLPANLFYNTSIPTLIMVLKKNRPNLDRSILFIDASQGFVHDKRQNKLSEENVQSILDLYTNRKDVEKKAHLASFDEIKKNDFNLNIPRYVDTFEKEADIDISSLTDEISATDAELKKNTAELVSQLKELTSEDPKTKEDLSKLVALLEKDGK